MAYDYIIEEEKYGYRALGVSIDGTEVRMMNGDYYVDFEPSEISEVAIKEPGLFSTGCIMFYGLGGDPMKMVLPDGTEKTTSLLYIKRKDKDMVNNIAYALHRAGFKVTFFK